MCPGVLEHPQLDPGGRHHVAAGQRLRAEHQRRVQRPHRRPGQLGEPPRAAGVVVVAVGEQDQRDRTAAGHPGQVRLVVLARVDDDARLVPGARSTQELVPSRVIGDGFSASSTEASGVTARSSP